jgi:electron transfer flavoprotein beta subunit
MTMEFFVALKWSALRVETDSLTGTARVLPGRYGPDPAGLAALEWARRLAAPVGARVTVGTVGPEAAEAVLRHALGLGASRAVRVHAADGADPTAVAAALAGPAAAADLVLTGAWSIDGGTAAVAPSLAALLGRSQACGLLTVAWEGEALVGERRLPAGRRERLRLRLPAVVSLEAGTIALRREPLPALLAAQEAGLEVLHPAVPPAGAREGVEQPYRPRPRTVPARPDADDPRERIAVLTGALEAAPAAQQLHLDPPQAAAAIVETLRRWGYLG